MIEKETLPYLRASELDSKPPEERWLIEGLWADRAVGLIGGSPKSCKSWLALEIATSVATGTPCLDRFEVQRKGPALVYLAEDALPAVRERLGALSEHRGLPLEALDLHVILTPSLRLDLEGDLERLSATLAKLRPRLLLLDPFVRIHRADENNAQEIAAILGNLRDLERLYEVAILIVHHTRKNTTGSQPGLALRGSGDLHAWGDSNLYLTHEQNRLKLTFEHRSAPAPAPLYLSLALNPPHLIILPPPKDAPTLDERILDALAKASPLGRGELRKRLGVNNQRLGQALEGLHALDAIRKTPQGWEPGASPVPFHSTLTRKRNGT